MKEVALIPQYKGSSPRSLILSKRPSQTYKEAAPKVRSGSYADGFADQSVRLPFTVMGSHVNLPATDHSEMASDIDRFSGCFLALCAKTLIKTYCDFGNTYSHKRKLLVVLESLERLVKSTSSAFRLKKEHLPQDKCSLISSLEERTLKVLVFPIAKVRQILKSAKNQAYLTWVAFRDADKPDLMSAVCRYSTGAASLLYKTCFQSGLVQETALWCTESVRGGVWYRKQAFPVRNCQVRSWATTYES